MNYELHAERKFMKRAQYSFFLDPDFETTILTNKRKGNKDYFLLPYVPIESSNETEVTFAYVSKSDLLEVVNANPWLELCQYNAFLETKGRNITTMPVHHPCNHEGGISYVNVSTFHYNIFNIN